MKKLLKSILFIASAAILAFASCSNDDDENKDNNPSGNTTQQTGDTTQTDDTTTQTDDTTTQTGGTNPTGGTTQTGGTSSAATTLPASVGENPFSGKTYTTLGGKLEFSDTTVKITGFSVSSSSFGGGKEVVEVNEEQYWIYEYNYSYDTTNQVLYLITTSYETKEKYEIPTNGKISSVEEYVNLYKNNITSSDESAWDSDTESYWKEYAGRFFSNVYAKKYEIDGDKLTLSDYFTGKLPITFEVGTGTEPNIDFKSTRFRIPGFESFPDFNNGTFTGTAYKRSSYTLKTYQKAGTISGTYETNGTGVKGWSVKIKFTSLPSECSTVQTNTEYTIESTESDYVDTKTYTLAK